MVGVNRRLCAEPSFSSFFYSALFFAFSSLVSEPSQVQAASNQTMADLTPSPSATTMDPTPLNLNTDQQSIIVDNSSLFRNMMSFNSLVKLDQNNFCCGICNPPRNERAVTITS